MVGYISTDTLENVELSSNARLLIEPLAVDDTGTPSTRVRTNITAGITAQFYSFSP